MDYRNGHFARRCILSFDLRLAEDNLGRSAGGWSNICVGNINLLQVGLIHGTIQHEVLRL